jgi:hypothetical protein
MRSRDSAEHEKKLGWLACAALTSLVLFGTSGADAQPAGDRSESQPSCGDPCTPEQTCCADGERCEDGRCVRRTLNGIWLDQANGWEVQMVQTGDKVAATYLEDRPCAHRNGSGRMTFTRFDFSGPIEGDKINGEMHACRYGGSDAGWIRQAIHLKIRSDWEFLFGHWVDSDGKRDVFISFMRLYDGPGPVGGGAQADCRVDPASQSTARAGSDEFYPFSNHTPWDIAPPCDSCPGAAWLLKSHSISWKPDPAWNLDRCNWTLDSVWECPTNGEVSRRSKHKTTFEACLTPPG